MATVERLQALDRLGLRGLVAGLGAGISALVLLLLPAAPAAADTEMGPTRLSGFVEVGGRMNWVEGDDSKFERYRDLSDGIFGRWDLLLEDSDLHYFLHTTAWNPGYDSQRYTVEGGRYGWWKLGGFYRQLPVVYSNNARSLYSVAQGNVFLLPSSLQQSIAALGGAAQSNALQAALTGARPVSLEYQWMNGGGHGEYKVTDHLLLRAAYQIHHKEGTRPFKLDFGSPGGTFIQLPAPKKEDIHEVKAGLDWSGDGFAFSFDYIGSIFQNDFDSLYGSNPLVANDVVGAGSLGRSSFMPDNQAHQFVLAGSAKLPIGIPNRVAANFAYQIRTQNDDFLPLTSNTAFTGLPPVARGSLDGRVDTVLGNVLFTARPMDKLHVKARYRIYSFDNSTESVAVLNHVVNDTTLATEEFTSIHTDWVRQNADTYVSYDLPGGLTPHLGFEWEYWRRSREREQRDLHTYGPALKLDWRLNSMATVRADYHFKHTEGNDYGTFRWHSQQIGPVAAADEAPIGQSVLLRKYTQADRNTHDIDFVGTVMPTDTTEFTLSGGYVLNNYRHTTLGLTESSIWHVGAEGGWRPIPRIGLGAWYTYEDETWEQDQRWRPRSFVNPPTFNVVDSTLNDWFSRTQDRYHTAGVRVDVDILPGRLDGEIGYVIHYGESKTIGNAVLGQATAPAPTTGGDGGNAVNWPTIRNVLNAVTATLNYHFNENVTIRGQYRFEDYDIRDFTSVQDVFQPLSNVDGSGAVSPSLDVWLGDGVNDYRAHIVGLSVIVDF